MLLKHLKRFVPEMFSIEQEFNALEKQQNDHTEKLRYLFLHATGANQPLTPGFTLS